MRLVFFGTSNLAIPALERLRAAGHTIAAVVTQPARPSGRGRRIRPGPVEEAAHTAGLAALTPTDPNTPEAIAELAAMQPELGVLVSYGRILSQELLDLPGRGFVNLHPSLLPAYRGAAPIQRALMDGASQTGISIIRMSRRVDAGDIIAQEPVPISDNETCGELSARLARLGAQLLVRAIGELERGAAQPAPQDPARATAAPKLLDRERFLDWTEPARRLHDRVRALSPEPGACTFFRARRLLVLRSAVSREEPAPAAEPGTIAHARPGIEVVTGSGLLALLELKPESGRTQTGAEFRNGCRLVSGERLAAPPSTGG